VVLPGYLAGLELDAKTRTVTVRVEFPNPTGELKPKMFGKVVLQGETRRGLRVPNDAVIDSGTRNIVFIALGPGQVSAARGGARLLRREPRRGGEGPLRRRASGHPRELPHRLGVTAQGLAGHHGRRSQVAGPRRNRHALRLGSCGRGFDERLGRRRDER